MGCGFVGSTAAYTHVLRGLVNELVFVDVNASAARAHAEDILHATPFARAVRVVAGDYSMQKDADVVILCCGVGQRPGGRRACSCSNVTPPCFRRWCGQAASWTSSVPISPSWKTSS